MLASRPKLLISAFFLLSGGTALVYQVVWTREVKRPWRGSRGVRATR